MPRTYGKDPESVGGSGTKTAQRERQVTHEEIRQLRNNVQALREKLEAQQLVTQNLVQAERQSSSAEIQQLKGTSTALREELEKQKLETQKLVQAEKQMSTAEIQQLQGIAAALREELEKQSSTFSTSFFDGDFDQGFKYCIKGI